MKRTLIRLLPPLFIGATLFFSFSQAFTAPSQVAERAAATVFEIGDLEIVYTNIVTDDSSLIPGLGGTRFLSGTSNTTFDRPYGTADGNWAMVVQAELDDTQDQLLLVNGTVRAQEGDSVSWSVTETIGTIDRKVGVNAGGEFIFATQTISGSADSDEYILQGSSGGVITITAQEGITTGLTGLDGSTWGSILESSVIADDGTAGFVARNVGGVPGSQNVVVAFGATPLLQKGVSSPTGQSGSETIELIDLDDYWVSSDGTHYLVQGDLSGSTTADDVVVYDGAVVVQEGSVLPNSGFTDPVDTFDLSSFTDGIFGVHLNPDGTRYLVRGRNATTKVDWVYSNGSVLAKSEDPIYEGTVESWTTSSPDFLDTFFLSVANNQGDYVIGGVSNGPSDTNGVLVFNNQAVLVREGDPIDLNGNSINDDDLFIDSFGDDDAFLTDDGTLYFVASMKNGAGTRVGIGFFKIKVSFSEVSLTQTAGTDPAACATDQAPEVEENSSVTYCFTVTNTGNISLTLHDLTDTKFGTLLDDFSATLAPGNSIFVTRTATITQTEVNTATWTAFNAGPVNSATSSDAMTVSLEQKKVYLPFMIR